MLPVVAGDAATLRRIVGYTVILVAASVVPFATGVFGPLYLAAALVLGGIFLALALRLRGRRHAAAPRPSSTTRCSTSRCSSSLRRSVRSSRDPAAP